MAQTDPSLSLFAARVLSKRLGKLQSLTEPVRQADDVEAVHRMRVACRRLRVGLELCDPALGDGKAKRWRRQVRRLGQALGAARDADVQIQFIDDYQQSLGNPGKATGIKRLHLRLTQQRQRCQPDVIHAVDNLEQSNLVKRMPDYLDRQTVKARLEAGRESPDEAALRDYARRAITERLDELLAHEPFVAQPHMIEGLHRMRFAAKALRYTMELFAEFYDGALDESIAQMRRVQQALGQVHDADMWIELLPQFLETERERTQEFFGHLRGFTRIERDLATLREHCIGQREIHYGQFTGLWRELLRSRCWQTLRNAFESSAQPSLETATIDPPPSPSSTLRRLTEN